MEDKIKKEVFDGSGPAHLLSVIISKTKTEDIKKTRTSNALKTDRQTLDSLYKSPI